MHPIRSHSVVAVESIKDCGREPVQAGESRQSINRATVRGPHAAGLGTAARAARKSCRQLGSGVQWRRCLGPGDAK
jgi:hypothetical protein